MTSSDAHDVNFRQQKCRPLGRHAWEERIYSVRVRTRGADSGAARGMATR